MNNVILRTDSYKLTHWNQYPEGTHGVYSYFEARRGAEHPATVFFGLQPILRSLAGVQVTIPLIKEAKKVADAHFGGAAQFNLDGWKRIVQKHNGYLPVKIKAVPEGSVVPVGNVLMTVENTDPACYWLTNALESVLTHVWYPTTVATTSYFVKQNIKQFLASTSDNPGAVDFMLHDFGYRGVSSDESAAIGGAAHLVNFKGTDTLLGMMLAMNEYGADLSDLGFSVPATEHSVMTSNGRAGEQGLVKQLIREHPKGILSVVADSYDIGKFVERMGTVHYNDIMARDGKFVVRPDSLRYPGDTPAAQVVDILDTLGDSFGVTTNSKGFRVLDPHVGVLWGDGIGPEGIDNIMYECQRAGWSVENVVFGMGGGLLQKVNRDTERFAFKCAAQKRNGAWLDVSKKPLDTSKTSKAGRMKLVAQAPHGWATVREDAEGEDVLQTVFENGNLPALQTFEEIRARASR